MRVDKTEREFREIVTGSGALESLPDRLIAALDLEFREEEGEGLPEVRTGEFPTTAHRIYRADSGASLSPDEAQEVVKRANTYPALEALAREAMGRLDWWQSTFDDRAEAGNERAGLQDTRSLIDRLRELLGEEGR